MKKFFYGLLTGFFLLPVLDGVVDIALQWVKYASSKAAIKNYEIQKIAEDLIEEDEPQGRDIEIKGFCKQEVKAKDEEEER